VQIVQDKGLIADVGRALWVAGCCRRAATAAAVTTTTARAARTRASAARWQRGGSKLDIPKCIGSIAPKSHRGGCTRHIAERATDGEDLDDFERIFVGGNSCVAIWYLRIIWQFSCLPAGGKLIRQRRRRRRGGRRRRRSCRCSSRATSALHLHLHHVHSHLKRRDQDAERRLVSSLLTYRITFPVVSYLTYIPREILLEIRKFELLIDIL
jgi:hypothetical protein